MVGSPDPAATPVDAAAPYGDSAFWGRKLSRAEALAPQIQEFWTVVDFLLVNEPSIARHVYHQARYLRQIRTISLVLQQRRKAVGTDGVGGLA